MNFQIHNWQRDARNPIFPPQEEFDAGACMNPCLVRRGDEYWMYYAGARRDGQRRICLAIANVEDLTNWKRLGPLFELGEAGAFDDLWHVLPCIHRFGDQWHLFYTGYSSVGEGLQRFRGIGLATSPDGLKWTRAGAAPLIDGSGFPQWPGNEAFGGGGPILEIEPGLFRMFCTIPTGRPSPDLLLDQQKHGVAVDSRDGFVWFNKQVLIGPRAEADYENAAAAGLNPWKVENGWRAVYSGIGTRFGAYSICEARSKDGVNWERGEPGESLALAPQGNGWESQMVEYPNIIEENGKLRMFYCGNGYGNTGIGTALAEPIEVLA